MQSWTMKSVGWGLALVLIATSAMVATGCGRRAARYEARQNALHERMALRYTQQLLRIASADTGCSPQQLTFTAITPEVYMVIGCGLPHEYLLDCPRRCRWLRIEPTPSIASGVLQCSPEMIQLEPQGSPMRRMASGCGRMASFDLVCQAEHCNWTQSGPVVARAQQPTGQTVHVRGQVSSGQSSGQSLVVDHQIPLAALQSQIAGQRDALLQCLGGSGIHLGFRWTAEGQVIVSLPPNLAGSATESCLNGILGNLRVNASAPGEVLIPVH